jgi:hypothetical protein
VSFLLGNIHEGNKSLTLNNGGPSGGSKQRLPCMRYIGEDSQAKGRGSTHCLHSPLAAGRAGLAMRGEGVPPIQWDRYYLLIKLKWTVTNEL